MSYAIEGPPVNRCVDVSSPRDRFTAPDRLLSVKSSMIHGW